MAGNIEQIQQQTFSSRPRKTVGQYTEAHEYTGGKSAYGHTAVVERIQITFTDLLKFTGSPSRTFNVRGLPGEVPVPHNIGKVNAFRAVNLVQAVYTGEIHNGINDRFHTSQIRKQVTAFFAPEKNISVRRSFGESEAYFCAVFSP